LKADDDVLLVDILKMQTFLCSLEKQEGTVVGKVMTNLAVQRDGKWAESNYIPELYPPFCLGSYGHAVSSDIAADVVGIDGFEYQGEDVSLGIWLDESARKNEITWLPAAGFRRDDDKPSDADLLFLGTLKERENDELSFCPAANDRLERLRFKNQMHEWRIEKSVSIAVSQKFYQWRSRQAAFFP
jgi:hypothetical protein